MLVGVSLDRSHKNQVKKKKCQTSSVPKECYVSPDSIRVCLLSNPDKDVLVKKNIRRIIPHPSYHPKKVIDDIALIELEHPVRCSYLPRPICLPTKNLSKIGTELTIAGYGFSDRNKVMGKQMLKEGFVTQVDSSKCPLPKDKNRQIVCAGGIKSNQSSCQGDSGTGIITLYKTNFYALGVTSVGPSNCKPDSPDSYTDVYAYMDWIKSVVKDLPTT
ncbi:plasma kallikrein [Trichonephila clavipes]|nr:plasma kallikrein [Trichonephila clavipes]